MRNWAVLIPSCSDEKLASCVESLFKAHPDMRGDQIVVISDGLPPWMAWFLEGWRWVEGKKPFVFAEAINAGAASADPGSDLVILGDDVRFVTSGAIDKLAQASTGAAIVAAEVKGVCGQSAQRQGSAEATAPWVAFICAYIPRDAWDAVGPLDERFVGYGYDDVDWCHRAAEHGGVRIAHDVTVRHLDDSSYRSNPDWRQQYRENHKLFDEKWAVL